MTTGILFVIAGIILLIAVIRAVIVISKYVSLAKKFSGPPSPDSPLGRKERTRAKWEGDH